MSIYMPGNDLRDHWFRIGRTEVGTTLLVCLVAVVGWIANVAAPALTGMTGLWFGPVTGGQVWRLVSWPLVESIGIWPVFNLFFFWMFGTEIEQQLGKVRMAQLLGGCWLVLTVLSLGLGALGLDASQAGLGTIEFLVFLLWIVDNARRPIFFGAPAWAVGAVLVAISLLQYLQNRAWGQLLCLVLGFLLSTLVARRVGLLRDQTWLPVKQASAPGSRKVRKAQQQAQRQADDRARDDARLDELLDLISAGGIDSLTSSQRRELMKLRNRRG